MTKKVMIHSAKYWLNYFSQGNPDCEVDDDQASLTRRRRCRRPPRGMDGPSGGQPIGGGPGAMQVMARVRPPADTPIIASACAARTGCDLSEPRGVPLALAAGSLFRFPNTERAVSSHTKRAGTEAGAGCPRCTAPPAFDKGRGEDTARQWFRPKCPAHPQPMHACWRRR